MSFYFDKLRKTDLNLEEKIELRYFFTLSEEVSLRQWTDKLGRAEQAEGVLLLIHSSNNSIKRGEKLN